MSTNDPIHTYARALSTPPALIARSTPPALIYGRDVHEFVADLAERVPVPSRSEVVELAAESARSRGGSTVKQMMLRVRLASAGIAYLPYRDPDFVYRCCEVWVPGGRLDIGWLLPDGRLLFDEVKSGVLLRPFDGKAVEAQIEAQRAGAVRLFGTRFAGLRVLRLFAPEQSFFLHPDGRRSPLNQGAVR